MRAVFGFLSLFLITSTNQTLSAQPINDDVTQAIQLRNGSIAYGSNVGASIQSSEPNFGTTLARKTVWWRYTANTTGIAFVIIRSDAPGTRFRSLGADVFVGENPTNSARRALSFVEQNGFFDQYIRLQFNTQAGRSYLIRVGTAQTSSLIPETNFVLNIVQHGAGGGVSTLPLVNSQNAMPVDPRATTPPHATNVTVRPSFSNFGPETNFTGRYVIVNTTQHRQAFSWRSSSAAFRFLMEGGSSLVPARSNRFVAGFTTAVPGMRFANLDGAPGFGQSTSIIANISTQTSLGSQISDRKVFPVAVHRYDRNASLSLNVAASNQSPEATMGTFTQTSILVRNNSGITARGCRIFKPYNANVTGSRALPSFAFDWQATDKTTGAVFDIRPGMTAQVRLRLAPHFVGTVSNIGLQIVCNNHRLTSYRTGLALTGLSPARP
jgi:hypothetical protein